MPVAPHEPEPRPSLSDSEAGLEVMPAEFDDVAGPVASASESTPMPVAAAGTPLVAPTAQPAAIPVPQTQRRNVPLVDMRRGVGADAVAGIAGAVPGAAAVASSVPAPTPAPAAPAEDESVATCLLIDRQTGRTFSAKAPATVIGRERSQAGVVLRDPNVSRRHAQLSFDGRDWHITDLNSTNGTLVNDVDVQDCVLRDGDLITLGLVNLEFREMRA